MAKVKIDPPSSIADEELNTRKLMGTVTAKLSKVSLLTSAACLGMVIVLWMMVPLKQSVPYTVHVNDKTGEVTVPPNQSVAQFTPGWKNISFFLRRWIRDLFTINQYLTVSVMDPRAQAFLRGANAISEYQTFRAKDNTFERLVSDPALVRDVKVLSITPVAGTKNGVVAQVQWTTHDQGKTSTVVKIVTIYYVFIQSNDMSTIESNPIGLYITDFKISSD